LSEAIIRSYNFPELLTYDHKKVKITVSKVKDFKSGPALASQDHIKQEMAELKLNNLKSTSDSKEKEITTKVLFSILFSIFCSIF
jgi:hypothetical protein